jgi:hypothetical protein
VLYGATATDRLAKEMQEMDMFLLTLLIKENGDYDGSNSHKIMEYLSTGKVCISNFNVTAFEQGSLLEMAKNNHNFFELFAAIKKNLDYYNSLELQRNRLQFALENSYSSHVRAIHQQLYA